MVAWLDREEIAKMRERRMRKIVRNLPPPQRKFALALGQYTLKVYTRSGLDDQFGVTVATRKVMIG